VGRGGASAEDAQNRFGVFAGVGWAIP
jgi:hypothetical protein